jgi:hypothetical protein
LVPLYTQLILAHRLERRRGRHSLAVVLVLVTVLATLAIGCGSSDQTSSSQQASTGEAGKRFQDPQSPKGVIPVATFGKASEDTERAEASDVLDKNLTARQEADFATQCLTLGKRGMEAVLGKGTQASATKCEAELKKVANPLSQSKAIRTDTLGGEIAVLRVKGNQAYALYHGTDGKDHAMPMEDEGGTWKVGDILTIELPPPKSADGGPKNGG